MDDWEGVIRGSGRLPEDWVNVAMWVLGGSLAGWVGFSPLGFNPKRGLLVSIVIGAIGGLVGGALLTPLLSPIPVNSEDFNPLAFVAAIALAVASLTVADMIHRRFGI